MRARGYATALFAFDIGQQLHLGRAEQRLAGSHRRTSFTRQSRAPEGASRLPLLLAPTSRVSVPLEQQVAEPALLSLYEAGAAVASYRIELGTPAERVVDLSSLPALSRELHGNEGLWTHARAQMETVLQALGDAVDRPQIGQLAEDYVVFLLQPAEPVPLESLWTQHGDVVARILRPSAEPLGEQERIDALALRLSFGLEDVTLVDWFAALLVGEGMDDELRVLELGVVELLEQRMLHHTLERAIDAAYSTLGPRGFLSSLRFRALESDRVAQSQMDAVVMHEGVHNVLYLLGDQYLARLYRAVSQRFHLQAWDDTNARKLRTLDAIYEKLNARVVAQRLEVLEWIVILLIAISIAVYFLPHR